MAELFGFEFKKKQKDEQLPSFAPPVTDDGAVMVAAGGGFGTYVDLDGAVRSEAELVTKYREMSMQPECDSAIDEIVNESISIEEEAIVDIDLDDLKLSEQVKTAIRDEFSNCLELLEFNKSAYDIYRRWYIDGRLYFHCVVDKADPSEGIKEIRYIDPRKIRKIREVQKKRIQGQEGNPSEATMTKTVNEYFVFNDRGFNTGKPGSTGAASQTTGLKIAKDSILHVVSGLTDTNGSMVLSYLHKSIKALNQLRTLEDSLVIYRLARAPERRIWYIDVGNLPKMKAEQYVRDIMVKHKNRLVYDANSGQVRDDRKFMTMLEDYWLPRREGGRGTEVTTLPGGQTLGQMDDVLYFQKQFLQSLNVPVSRLNSDALFSIGRATEITRDELKFSKFIIRLRARFSQLFLKILEKQLVLKGIVTVEDWQMIQQKIKFDYNKDNYFTELKNAEILEGRFNLARNAQDMAGKYVSHAWVRKHIMQQSDDEIDQNDEEIALEAESEDPRWINPLLQPQIDPNAVPEEGMPPPEAASAAPTPEDNKAEEVRQAKVLVDQMKKKGKNRTMQDESKYKAAVQVLAKNPDIVKSMGTGKTQTPSE